MAALRRQTARKSSQDEFSSLSDATKATEPPADKLHGHNAERKVLERVGMLRSSDVWGNNEPNQLTRSFPEVIQIYSHKTTTSLKLCVRFAYPSHVVWLNATERKRRYLFDREYTSLGFLPSGIAELGVYDGDLEVGESVTLPRSHMVRCSASGENSTPNALKRCAKSGRQNAGRSNAIFSEAAETLC